MWSFVGSVIADADAPEETSCRFATPSDYEGSRAGGVGLGFTTSGEVAT